MRLFIIVVLVVCVQLPSFAQKKVASLYVQDSIALKKAIKLVENKYQIKFSYPSDLISDQKINLALTPESQLSDVLFEISSQAGLQFNKLNETYYYIVKDKIQYLDEVFVKRYLTKGIDKQKDGSFNFTPQSLGLLAGLIEPDILESIQQLPGVMSISETATQLNVRGGTPDQNQIIWDDINIYHGGHLFGMVSVFNPNVAQKIVFYNKATHVRYGDRIASVIDIKTLNKIPNKTSAQAGINGISTDVYLHTPLVKDKLAVQLSFRRSYEDLIETPTFVKYEEKAFQNTIINDEFFYFKDYNFSLNYNANENHSFKLSFIHIDNDFESEYETEEYEWVDLLDSENDGYSLQWNYKMNDKLKLISSASGSNYRLDYANITGDDGDEDEDLQAEFIKENYVNDYNFYTELHLKPNVNQKFLLGYQLNYKDVSYLFQENKDIIYILDADSRNIFTHSLYTSFHWATKKHFSFDIGLRANYYDDLNTFKLAPRFIINHNVTDKFVLQFSGELKNQIISQIEETVLNDFRLENKIWRLSDGENFPIISAKHFSLGGKYTLGKFYLDFDIFHKTVEGISALSLGFLNPNDNQFHTGTQKINGVEVLVKKRMHQFSTWFTYTYMDVRNKYDGINNEEYFTANTQIKHSFSINATYNFQSFQTAVNWQIRSGKPLTELAYDAFGNAYIDTINTATHPVYHRLDFSATYKFRFSNQVKAKAGISIRNVYNNQNLINTEFYGHNSINDPIRTVPIYAIGFTPNFMFRVFW